MGRLQTAASFLIVAAACSRSGTLNGPEAKISDSDPGRSPVLEELAQTTYGGVFDRPITLVDGRWEGEPYVEGGVSRPSVGLVDHFILIGDLDGDGVDDAAALLWESSGGSGTRLYLAAMGRHDQEFVNLGTILVGDRVQIRSGAIDDGKISLAIVRAGPEDAACCPTETAVATWALSENGLTSVGDEITGRLSLADLDGSEWALVELGRDQPLPEEIEISLAFQDDRVSGKSGCNSYFAGITAENPGELDFNGMGATRMACPEPAMEFERRYLTALSSASKFSLLAGRLVLTCDTDEGLQELVFTPGDHSTGFPQEPGK